MFDQRRRMAERRQKQDLKQIIRSIIESNGNKMTIKSLIKEYKETIESDLPLTQLNYETIVDLIRDMDDTFGIEIKDKHRHQNDYNVYCLPDQNTRHIVDLVQNQKHSENDNKEVLNPSVNVFHSKLKNFNHRPIAVKPFELKPNIPTEEETNGHQINGCNHRMNGLYFDNHLRPNNQKTVNKAICPLPDSRVITNEVKSNISEVMSKYNSINLLNFGVIYYLYHKTPIDFKNFGFASLDQFLSQMPDLVRLEKCLDGIRVVYNRPKQPVLDKPKVNGVINGVINGHQNGLNINGLNKSKQLIQNQNLEAFRQILRNHPKGTSVPQFMDEYSNTYRKPFISSVWGYGSPIEMFSAMRDIFYLKQPENGSQNMDDWLLFEATPELVAPPLVTTVQRKPTDQQLVKEVNEVMAAANRSVGSKEIFVEHFSDAFELIHKRRLDPKKYGFNNFNHLLKTISKDCNFEYKERVKKHPFVIYSKKL